MIMHIIGGMETTLLIHKQYGVDGQRTPLVSRVRYLCCILPCLILRVRGKSEAQPKGTKQPNVLGAHRYCLDEEVQLSSLCNPQYIYIIASDSALWHRQSGNDIDSVRS